MLLSLNCTWMLAGLSMAINHRLMHWLPDNLYLQRSSGMIRCTRDYFPCSLLWPYWLLILILPSASADAVGWRVTFKVVDTLTGSSSQAGRPFEEQPHELHRKWKVYTGNWIVKLVIYIHVSGPLRGLLEEIQQITLIHLQSKPPSRIYHLY